MRWPKASPSVLSTVDGKMPKLDAISRLTVALRSGPAFSWSEATSVICGSALSLSRKIADQWLSSFWSASVKRVLILGLGHATADGDVLRRLHVKRDALNLARARLQPGDDLVGAGVALGPAASAQ